MLARYLKGIPGRHYVLHITNTPPGSPAVGDRYIVNTGGTGDWSGHDTEIAEWFDTGWQFEVPLPGYRTWNVTSGSIWVFDGSDWNEFLGSGGAQPLDATLTALAALGAPAGLIEKTALDTFTERAIGVGASTSIPTRGDADTRYVQPARSISTTAPLTGGGDLSANRTLAISDFVASGGSHAKGAVPDPGATAGTRKFLREDASWAIPLLAFCDPSGWRFDFTSTSTITAVSVGLGGYGFIPVTDGTDVWLVASSSDFTMALSTSGSGGLHNDHSEAANTGYDVYFAVATDGTIALFSVPTGTTVDATKIAALTGASKTWTAWSTLAWFVSNDNSSNILEFRPEGPRAFQYAARPTNLSSNGATTPTAIPLVNATGSGPLVPAGGKCKYVILNLAGTNTGSTARDCQVWEDSGGTKSMRYVCSNLANASGRAQTSASDQRFAIEGETPATALYFSWSGAVTGGLASSVAEVGF